MIQDLLDFSRIEARQLTIVRQDVDLAALVRACIDSLTPEAPGRPLELRAHGPIEHVQADPDRLAQVMDNLLTNALKYGEPGTPITVDIQPRTGCVEVSVTNEGRGIAPNQQPRLFQRFQRIDARKGVGLGLYIARKLVEAHGGSIGVESRPGATTTFHFTIPGACSVITS